MKAAQRAPRLVGGALSGRVDSRLNKSLYITAFYRRWFGLSLHPSLAFSLLNCTKNLLSHSNYLFSTFCRHITTIRFYGDYKKSREWQLRHFYEGYVPGIVEGEYTCVGLGLELITRLADLESSIGNKLCLVSCEEAIEDEPDTDGYYVEGLPSPLAEKEHVLVSAKIDISGRTGVLLLDPGYHVARVVTVMKDSAYPHTGWFTQTHEPWVKREYRYFFPDHTMDYVIWEVKETRGNKVKLTHNLIYVAQPFESGVEFTEKRNLVYNFKSWLVRNIKGEIVAGLYFSLQEAGSDVFTITCTDSNANKQRLKLRFSDFLQKKEFSPEESSVLELCGKQLGMGSNFNNILCSIAEILTDSDFILQVLDINEEINNISP